MSHALSFLSMTAATLFWFRFGRQSERPHPSPRVLAAIQVGLVLAGWFRLRSGHSHSPETPLTIYSSAAPESTLRYLLYALAGEGSALYFPFAFLSAANLQGRERYKSG